jgi:hypothetical protein
LAISIFYLLSYLPLGLLCLLGYFASWALYRHFASQAMSHRHCLLQQCRNTAMPLGLLCLLGCFASWALYRHFASQAMSHRHCLL